jgi:hypothetical protein
MSLDKYLKELKDLQSKLGNIDALTDNIVNSVLSTDNGFSQDGIKQAKSIVNSIDIDALKGASKEEIETIIKSKM